MKKGLLLCCVLCILCMSISGASATQVDVYNSQVDNLVESFHSFYEASGDGEKMTAYDDTLTVKMVNWYNSSIVDYMATLEERYGESLENNRLTDAILKALNIDIEYDWLANNDNGDYMTKLRLAIATGDLPDMFIVNDQADVMQLAEAGAIWDVSELIDQWAGTLDKEIWASDGGALLQMVTYEGGIYGLPAGVSDTDSFSYMWIRKDWLDKLGLSMPTTMEELKAVMDAFIKADFDGNGIDDSYGIALDKDLYYTVRGILNAFGAYPEYWVKDEADTVVWGGIQEECKAALQFMNELYEAGYIDPEFVTHSNADAMENVISGKCGIVFGGHWLPAQFESMLEHDPDMSWYCPKLPTATGEDVVSALKPSYRGWVVINKNFEHPEAAFKIRALCSELLYDSNIDAVWWAHDGNGAVDVLKPFQGNVSAWYNLDCYREVQACYANNGDTSSLTGGGMLHWNNLHGEDKWFWTEMFGPQDGTPFQVLENAISTNNYFYDAFLGPQSQLMIDRWSTIQDEQLRAFTKIIIGEVTVEEGFDAWVKSFDEMGGAKITSEVNDWYNSVNAR